MMGIAPPSPPVWDKSSPEQIPVLIQRFPSSTSLCGITGCPLHQVLLPRKPDDDYKEDLHTADSIRGEIIQPHVHLTPNLCNMITAETMFSPGMTSGTTITIKNPFPLTIRTIHKKERLCSTILVRMR